jgi:F-type H+-transporting ATPase subunit epsilon
MLKVSVISPERVLFEGEVDSVVAPAFDGEVGILTSHAPMVTLLGRGTLRLTGGSGGAAGGARRFAVEGGFLQVADDAVRVVTEHATEEGAR